MDQTCISTNVRKNTARAVNDVALALGHLCALDDKSQRDRMRLFQIERGLTGLHDAWTSKVCSLTRLPERMACPSNWKLERRLAYTTVEWTSSDGMTTVHAAHEESKGWPSGSLTISVNQLVDGEHQRAVDLGYQFFEDTPVEASIVLVFDVGQLLRPNQGTQESLVQLFTILNEVPSLRRALEQQAHDCGPSDGNRECARLILDALEGRLWSFTR